MPESQGPTKVLIADDSLVVLHMLEAMFQGTGFDDYLRSLRADFSRVSMRKPKASRARSREVYALAVGLKSGGAQPGGNRV